MWRIEGRAAGKGAIEMGVREGERELRLGLRRERKEAHRQVMANDGGSPFDATIGA